MRPVAPRRENARCIEICEQALLTIPTGAVRRLIQKVNAMHEMMSGGMGGMMWGMGLVGLLVLVLVVLGIAALVKFLLSKG
jgi:hypothetical protein